MLIVYYLKETLSTENYKWDIQPGVESIDMERKNIFITLKF